MTTENILKGDSCSSFTFLKKIFKKYKYKIYLYLYKYKYIYKNINIKKETFFKNLFKPSLSVGYSSEHKFIFISNCKASLHVPYECFRTSISLSPSTIASVSQTLTGLAQQHLQTPVTWFCRCPD